MAVGDGDIEPDPRLWTEAVGEARALQPVCWAVRHPVSVPPLGQSGNELLCFPATQTGFGQGAHSRLNMRIIPRALKLLLPTCTQTR